MSITVFASPEDAEAAFYAALERGDLDALMAVWAEDEEITCIHPTGQRLVGHAAIRESWRAVLAANPRLRVAVSQSLRWGSALLAAHNVVETLYVGDDPTPHGPMLATNVFARGAHGWRMVAHHTSASSEPALGEAGGPRVLH